jgi:hypothetical protein
VRCTLNAVAACFQETRRQWSWAIESRFSTKHRCANPNLNTMGTTKIGQIS